MNKIKTDKKDTAHEPLPLDEMYSRTFHTPDLARCDVINEILGELERQGLDSEILFMVRLAIDEAIINAILHGHGENLARPNTPVRIDCLIDDKCLAVRVTDNGLGFNPAAVPDPTLDENLWKLTGRGIFLMREAMDDVIYNSIGNSVLMIYRLQDA